MDRQAARPKGKKTLDDEPVIEPMRATRQGEIRRNPSNDQVKQRHQQQRQRKTAEWTPGHVSCQSCGHIGHPVLGDATAPNCAACGSYSISSTKPKQSEMSEPGAHVDNRTQKQPSFVATRKTAGDDEDRADEIFSREHTSAEHLWADPDSVYSDQTCPGCKVNPDKTKIRRRVQATILNTDAWRLNPGDNVRMPNGRTMKVHRIRPHETSNAHVYVDTDSGTSLSGRYDPFEVVHSNAQQQSLPGYGTPGGNSNKLPFDPQSSHGTNAAPDTSAAPGAQTQCPACKKKGTLQRQGDHYTCSSCGYRETFGGAGGRAFSDAPRRVITSRQYSTINTSGMSAIARRAREVLAQEENS